MALLFDADYEYLGTNNLRYEEDESARFLILRDFPLPEGVYVSGGQSRTAVDVLYIIPPNYNTEGGDMMWLYPALSRADGQEIPAANGPGVDSRMHNGVEYLRWSRHWNNRPWKPKQDGIEKIVDRLTWAFAHPTPLER
jgi:hypothetical protein